MKSKKVTRFGLHWLTVSIWTTVGNVMAMYCDLLGLDGSSRSLFELRKKGLRGFQVVHDGPLGGQIYSRHGSADEEFVSLDLPGELLEVIEAEKLSRVFGEYVAVGTQIRASRVDTAFDTIAFRPEQVLKSILSGALTSRVQRNSWTEYRNGDGGHTVYFGAPTSERRLRCYLRVEEKGKPRTEQDEYTRYEMMYRGEWAERIFADLLDTPFRDWPGLSLNYARKFAEYDRNWWRWFVGHARLEVLKAKEYKERSVEETLAWLDRQVAPTLAMVRQHFKGDMGPLYELLASGDGRLSAKHRAILARSALVGKNSA